MNTFTITSETFSKIFGLKQKITNTLGLSLSYHAGMISGKTTFFKQGVCWLTVSNKGDLEVDGRMAGIIKNKCAPENDIAVIATITSAKECARALVLNIDKNRAEMVFTKEGKQIATAKGSMDGVTVNFENSEDLWMVLVLGWCSLNYIFLQAWDKITYYDPAPVITKPDNALK